MTQELITTTVDILGKPYQIKCPESEMEALQRSAKYLEDQMRTVRDVGNVLSIDRMAVITALNIVHQFITLERESNHNMQTINQRLHNLQNKVDNALAQTLQMELQPAG